ncbi:putative mitochondrial gpi transamidase component, putative (GPI16) [Leptomonas pyrrhocoris]|uniref:Putative mitochondrial gpi transamidase component, putative (GPI16) n=1 Tax=Leptomonas pyrrhocoris TaxID=157538 RepID=A0A0M9G563_LEPPY|nr:putative mitochondrial gpi transamidase component, putative (GPI16) [Leptomonas pyrrhocoris]KPA82346.1 putative mitochondrial gpi transamidase component, putative (GPI16) [Leptomonas pyrrhocoris]|eukprot:XP_015660785.1 putative mitochondrial gpi transamidase component, putative (GPI16) [Leptomonas pyrrhocoris]
MAFRFSQLIVLLGLFVGLLSLSLTDAVATEAARKGAYVPLTRRRYTMLIEELTGGLDEKGTRPTLVSVTEEKMLTLPAKSAAAAAWEGDAEASEIDTEAAATLTFDEDFDPIWYYVLRRRGFEHLDWSGCGGKWRPEWSIPKRSGTAPPGNEASELLFDQLHHYLAHHAVCTYSSVSFCGASHERDAASQFQWAAQFISTLTSSPLSWTSATPRHTQPNGILLESHCDNVHRGTEDVNGGAAAYWCSYHLVYHDTLCTQHVSPLLNGGRSGRGVQEGLPQGIFKAVFPSFVHFFGSPFHHFTVKATQERRPANVSLGTPAVVELKVQLRMSMVAREQADLEALASVWARELPAYADGGRLAIYVGPGGLSASLRAALPESAIVSEKDNEAAAPTKRASDDVAASTEDSGDGGVAVGWSPEVRYEVHSRGKDHGYLTVELQPALATLDAQVGVHVGDNANAGDAASRFHQYRLREGDVVRTLLLFPLHLIRPSLYNMESLVGSTRLVHAHTDVSSNTLAALLETPVTAVHVAAYEAAYAQALLRHHHGSSAGHTDRKRGRPEGVMLGRFPLSFGWTALHSMPPDDNGNRIVPQPVVVITRPFNTSESAAEEEGEKDFCAAQRDAGPAQGVPPLDHVSSLAAMFQMLNHTFVWRDGKAPAAASSAGRNSLVPSNLDGGAASTCVYWVRSTVASGTTIPGPDGAMVFNVLSLGLVFSAVGAGIFTRVTRRLTLQPEDLDTFMKAEAD